MAGRFNECLLIRDERTLTSRDLGLGNQDVAWSGGLTATNMGAAGLLARRLQDLVTKYMSKSGHICGTKDLGLTSPSTECAPLNGYLGYPGHSRRPRFSGFSPAIRNP